MTGLIIFMALTMAYNTYEQYKPIKTVVVNSIKILTPEIKQGGTLKYLSDYCRYTENQITVYKTVVDVNDPTNRYALSSVTKIPLLGCHITEVSTNIDPVIPLGTYYLEVFSVEKINSTRDIKRKTIIGNFKIN